MAQENEDLIAFLEEQGRRTSPQRFRHRLPAEFQRDVAFKDYFEILRSYTNNYWEASAIAKVLVAGEIPEAIDLIKGSINILDNQKPMLCKDLGLSSEEALDD